MNEHMHGKFYHLLRAIGYTELLVLVADSLAQDGYSKAEFDLKRYIEKHKDVLHRS